MPASEIDIYTILTESIVISEEEDGIYIYNFATGKEFKTNETGKDILELCKNRTSAEIAKELAQKHEKDYNAVMQDVENFLKEALKEGLVKKVEKNE